MAALFVPCMWGQVVVNGSSNLIPRSHTFGIAYSLPLTEPVIPHHALVMAPWPLIALSDPDPNSTHQPVTSPFCYLWWSLIPRFHVFHMPTLYPHSGPLAPPTYLLPTLITVPCVPLSSLLQTLSPLHILHSSPCLLSPFPCIPFQEHFSPLWSFLLPYQFICLCVFCLTPLPHPIPILHSVPPTLPSFPRFTCTTWSSPALSDAQHHLQFNPHNPWFAHSLTSDCSVFPYLVSLVTGTNHILQIGGCLLTYCPVISVIFLFNAHPLVNTSIIHAKK